MSTTVALAVGADWAGGTPEERLLLEALADRGIEGECVVWEEGTEPLQEFDCVIVRACWDYHKRPGRFRRWLQKLQETSVSVWNPPEMLLWNMNKMYLKELREMGLPVVPSVFMPGGTPARLRTVMERKRWDRVVVKPLVGAGARTLLRIDTGEVEQHEERVEAMAQDPGIIVQPYLEELETDGEWSFVFLGGRYRYAIHKTPESGDFRVQERHGGSYRHADPGADGLEQARECVSRITKPWLYLRVDGVVVENRLRIMEVEALEPSLYFGTYPAGAEYFSEAIRSYVVDGDVPAPAHFVRE